MEPPNRWLRCTLMCLVVCSGFSSSASVLFGRRINNKLEAKISSQGCSHPHKEKYFEQQVDHFSFTNSDTFQMRYLVSDELWTKGGPIFFYTGNEGDITWFCQNTGFVWDLAVEYKAIVIFAEHRYYGKSLPYGNDSYKDAAHLGYLTAEQALADFAVFLDWYKANTLGGAAGSPVVAFGGSYGGMLAAWMRIKYPNAIAGAIAASAPVWQFTGLTPCNTQYLTISKDFQAANQLCYDSVHMSWDVIERIGQSASGRTKLVQAMKLCDPLKTTADVDGLISWLAGSWFNLAMVDYPYPANFLEPLPAFPIKEVCSYFKTPSPTDDQLLAELTGALGVYYNYTSSIQCFNLSQDATASLGDLGWSFQACTEMVMPFCADGVDDMFYPMPWDYDAQVAACKAQWNVTPRPNWIVSQFGGKNITASSNIFFSNGLLDPWHLGGVLTNLSDTLVAGIIPDGAHHLDLRGKNKLDPPSVIAVRNQERENINRWIAEWWMNKRNSS